MKPIVRYDTSRPTHIGLGSSAVVTPVDHPNSSGLIVNGYPIRTSRVISLTVETGEFETDNTIYIPESDHQRLVRLARDEREIAYLAAPYSHRDPVVTESRMKLFAKCDAVLMARGIFTVSPLLKHLVRTHVNDMPGDWKFWSDYSEVLLRKCNSVIVLKMDGWEVSTGVQGEIALAKKHSIPIQYVDIEEFLGVEAYETL